ncbi:MAG: hypothetical protein A3I61_06115 [Acidobacteria bacterium RIFCSPLOWO2_02_FULL_68_18]|nr:MAG: hypothetical protein A3I61_06115 [Acidobacteria bacterium RIFCSPLOWO2_02_FULL_68_18]OFW51987.1 MAG: hypothetical protein A3G77_04515 [Acidobacteria bacterium RIFCSPLOWO2_12_FULL_68_19]
MTPRLASAAVLVSVAAAIGAGVALWIVRDRLLTPYKGYASIEQFVDIPAGTATAAIGRRLVEAGVVRDGFTFRAALWWTRRSRALQAGEYRFDRPLAPVEVVDRLARGDVYARRITFPEGLTIAEMARVYEAREFGSAASFAEAARDVSLIRDLDPLATDLEGYLFPDTYALPRGTPAPRLVASMVERFQAAYAGDLRRRAEEQGLTTRQVVTLASLVEKETGRPEERPLVAAVYRNRLKVGMGLQADPTVVYALRKAGRYDGNIRRQDLALDSPYNTYRHAGLPPGPVAAPGQASLGAALMPAPVSYLYFVSRNDGSHVFATTLAEHNRNVRRFQVLYFRR